MLLAENKRVHFLFVTTSSYLDADDDVSAATDLGSSPAKEKKSVFIFCEISLDWRRRGSPPSPLVSVSSSRLGELILAPSC